mmetsp:Transcript_34651/g.87100  ORF Transcript_34651/g.87100 Transcript_34651/m.87100 type:complete len:223 (-) Transcript_34651:197-865(-)
MIVIVCMYWDLLCLRRRTVEMINRLVLLLVLLGEKNQDANEQTHKVDEELRRMKQKVAISQRGLFDDELCVEHHVAREDDQTQVEQCVLHGFRREEELHEREHQQPRDGSTEDATQIEVAAATGQKRCGTEAGEQRRGGQQSSVHDCRIDLIVDQMHQRTERTTHHTGKAEKKTETGRLVGRGGRQRRHAQKHTDGEQRGNQRREGDGQEDRRATCNKKAHT